MVLHFWFPPQQMADRMIEDASHLTMNTFPQLIPLQDINISRGEFPQCPQGIGMDRRTI